MAKSKKTRARAKPRTGIWLIVVFKVLKGLILLVVGVGALSLLHDDVAAQVTRWLEVFRVDPNNHFIHTLIRKLWAVDDKKLEAISAGTFFYAALVSAEGIGLALRKKWAEYFTIFVTTSLIPLEIYELVQKFSFMKILMIAVNVAVVVYLAIGLHEVKK
jgi:uncharacterized membrane protein (DUF2068 family)